MALDPCLVPIMMTESTYRVPVWVNPAKDLFTVCVGKEQYRHYTDDTVPGQIKASLSMIHAFPEEMRVINLKARTPDNYLVLSMACPNADLRDIGWQIGDQTYVVIVPNTLLKWMQTNG